MERKRESAFDKVIPLIALLFFILMIALGWIQSNRASERQASHMAQNEAVLSNFWNAMEIEDYDLATKELYKIPHPEYVPTYNELFDLVKDNKFITQTTTASELDYRNLWKKYEVLVGSYPDNRHFISIHDKVKTLTLEKEKLRLEKQRADEQEAKERQLVELAKKKEYLKKHEADFWVTEDKLESNKFYHHKDFSNSRTITGLYTYIGLDTESEHAWMRLSIQYGGADWLFVEGYTVYVDGRKFERQNATFERDHRSNVWEWSDTTPNAIDYIMLKAVMRSKEAVIRYHGNQYRKDYTITAKEKAALKETFDYYDALGGEYN